MIESILQEDAVLPGQFPTLGLKRYRSGEHRLMLAVLCDAAYAYSTEGGRRRGLRMRREIEQWFESGNTAYVFSFESICDALGLDASYVRRRVLGSGRKPADTTLPTAAAA